jgi:signal transduction histidine kinase
VTAVSSHFTSKQFFESVEERHEEMTDLMTHQAEFHEAVDSGDPIHIRQVVQTVTDESMQVRWVWFEQTTSREFRPALDQASDISEDGTTSSMIGMANGERSLFTYYPLESKGRHGAIEIASSLEPVDAQSKQTWLTALLSIGVMGLCSIGVVMTAGVRWIAQPLNALTRKMERVGQGDFSSDLKIHSNDELGQLASAVNQMCEQLQEQKCKIENETNQRLLAMEQLRHADRLKTVGQLAAGFAHEVGTPLNVVTGRASMILTDHDMSAEKVQENARAIKSESERISAIIKKLLDFARRGGSQQIIGDLRQVVHRAVDLIQPLAAKRSITIETTMPEKGAPCDIDFNQMQQVVMNLIDNAVDASPECSQIDISLTPDIQHQRWVLDFIDHGEGMNAATQSKIFEPFFTTKEIGSGTGLGLSIVHGIIDEHGGKIELKSELGQGSRFRVLLPMAGAAEVG